MKWKREKPSVASLNGATEEFFWVRGGNFNRPVMVRATHGVNSSLTDWGRVFHAEVNFTILAENYPVHIWSSDLHEWAGTANWEWAGPVPQPATAISLCGMAQSGDSPDTPPSSWRQSLCVWIKKLHQKSPVW